jgi:hypothetical protein
MVGAVPGQVDALAADLERAPILEGLLVRRSRRIIVAQQQPPRLLVSDSRDLRSNREDAPTWSAWWRE